MPSPIRPLLLVALTLVLSACAATGASSASATAAVPAVSPATGATLAQIYFWRALPGHVDEYSRYIRDVAEPIDREAQRAGAFLDVTTLAVSDTTLPWTHMRVFLLRDTTQLLALGPALTAAGLRLQPDSTRRRAQGEYAATLRERIGAAVARIVK